MLGAALAAGWILARRREQPAALSAALQAQDLRLAGLESEIQRQARTMQSLESAVTRLQGGFSLLGDRLAAQVHLLQGLQASYAEKEQKLQAALHAVMETIQEIRRARAASALDS